MSGDSKQTGAAGADGKAQEPEPISRAVAKPALGAVPVAKRGAIYTINAQEGLNAAELVNVAFGKRTIGSRTPRRLEVLAPDGPSTTGKPVRQTIRLVPLSGDTGPVMCGFLDVTQKIVELRSYETVTQQYEARYGVVCDITAEEFATLSRELQMTLTPFRYSFTQEAERKDAVAHQRAVAKLNSKSDELAEKSVASRFNLIMLGVFVVIAACVALTLLR